MKPENQNNKETMYIWESKLKVHNLNSDGSFGDNEIVYEFVIAPTAGVVVDKIKAAWEIPGQRVVGFMHTIPKADINNDGFVDMYPDWQNKLLP